MALTDELPGEDVPPARIPAGHGHLHPESALHHRQGYLFSSDFVIVMLVVTGGLFALWAWLLPRLERRHGDVPMPESGSSTSLESSARRRRRFIEGMSGGVISEAPLDEVAPPRASTVRTVHLSGGQRVSVRLEGDDDARGHTFVTYHDVGSNPSICFNAFFQIAGKKGQFDNCRVIHITAPGHEDGAAPWEGPYPTMDELGDQVEEVLNDIDVSRPVILFGVGAGVNVLLRFAARHSARVVALISCGGTQKSASVSEWVNFTVSLDPAVACTTRRVSVDLTWTRFASRCTHPRALS